MRGIEQVKMGPVLSSGLIHCNPPILQSLIVLVTHIDIVTRATLMWTINDFLAYRIVSGWSMHVKLKYSYCMENNKAFTLTNRGKTFFLLLPLFLANESQVQK